MQFNRLIARTQGSSGRLIGQRARITRRPTLGVLGAQTTLKPTALVAVGSWSSRFAPQYAPPPAEPGASTPVVVLQQQPLVMPTPVINPATGLPNQPWQPI